MAAKAMSRIQASIFAKKRPSWFFRQHTFDWTEFVFFNNDTLTWAQILSNPTKFYKDPFQSTCELICQSQQVNIEDYDRNNPPRESTKT